MDCINLLRVYFLACITPGVRVRGHMLNVGKFKVMEFHSFCIFSWHFNFVYHTNKAPLQQKLMTGAHPVTGTSGLKFVEILQE